MMSLWMQSQLFLVTDSKIITFLHDWLTHQKFGPRGEFIPFKTSLMQELNTISEKKQDVLLLDPW